MKILIIKSFAHHHTGWSYLSKYIKNMIETLFHQSIVEIKDFPYTSTWTSSYYFYSYKNIDIKENYDLIFVCEGKPSKKWAKNGKVIWIPCQEFMSGGPWNLIRKTKDYWYSILSPSKYLYDKIKIENPNIPIDHIQLWSEPFPLKEKVKNDNLKLFIHFKTRNWGQEFWIKLIKRIAHNFPEFQYVFKIDNHADVDLNNININNVNQLILGNIKDRSRYINALSESDIYFAPRIMEGIGLCSQEAIQLGNVLIGPDYTTHNEYFAKENGLILECKEYKTDKSQTIMGEQKTISFSEKQIPRIIDSLRELNENRDKLIKIQKYNREYSIQKFEDFKVNFKEYIQNNISKTPSYQKIAKILHIQFCLEGGQGLISTIIASGLQKYNNSNNTFYYLSNQDEEVAIKSYLDRLNNQDIKHYLIKNIDDIKHDDYDAIFVHWSSSAEKRDIDFNKWYEWIESNKKPTIGLIYDSVMKMPDICNHYCVASNFNIKFSPDEKRTFIVPYPIEDCFYDNKISLDHKSSPFVIGRTSRIIERKFNKSFVPIAKYINNHYPNVSFDIIGDGEYERYLRKDLLKWGVEFNIRQGFYDERRAYIMGSADICLYLTSDHEESFGLAVAEYLALGIPVVCENKGALKETIGEGGLVCDNLNDVLDNCEKLITDVKFKKEISKKAKLKAKEYSEEKVSNKYKKIINEILNTDLNNPKWSIIMPAYNVEKYIKDAINSMTNQKLENWELIIINDSSKDKTQDIINSFKDHRIKNIQIQNGPHSQSFCWQKGLEISKGKYLGFLDSDDYLIEDALIEMNEYYEKNPDIICAWSQNEKWDKDLSKMLNTGLSENPYKYGSLINGMLIEPGVIVSHFLTCKRLFLNQIGGFNTLLPTSADRWLALNMDLVGKLGFVDKVLHKYRFLRPGCVTLERRQEQIQTVEKILNEALQKRNDSRTVELIIEDDNFNYKLNINDLSIN